MNCAVCKEPETDKMLLLSPHTEGPTALVLIHTKCMGGLPLIALKWKVIDQRLEHLEKPVTLLEVLTLGLESLQDFDERR